MNIRISWTKESVGTSSKSADGFVFPTALFWTFGGVVQAPPNVQNKAGIEGNYVVVPTK